MKTKIVTFSCSICGAYKDGKVDAAGVFTCDECSMPTNDGLEYQVVRLWMVPSRNSQFVRYADAKAQIAEMLKGEPLMRYAILKVHEIVGKPLPRIEELTAVQYCALSDNARDAIYEEYLNRSSPVKMSV
jgi:hypothetical protein